LTVEPPAGAAGHTAILAAILEVARDHLGWRRELPLEARLIEDLELDSIRLLTLAVEVENRFRIVLDPEDEEGIVTVADLVETVARRLAEKEPNEEEEQEQEQEQEEEERAGRAAGEQRGGEP